MWTLPGYGDHLERDGPGLRTADRRDGRPAGFEDVVASINPIPRRAARRPSALGRDVRGRRRRRDGDSGRASSAATVVVAPFDAPWVRMTVIADPQGATFIASKFDPENRDTPSAAPASASAG